MTKALQKQRKKALAEAQAQLDRPRTNPTVKIEHLTSEEAGELLQKLIHPQDQ